jgi:hypothetical protein
MLLVILKTLIDVLPWLNIPFSNDVRKSIVMLSCDQSSSVLHQLRVNHRSNQLLNPELVLFGLAQTLWFKLKIWLLSMHCIACAFGKHGYTNVHPHETPYPYPTSLVWWCRYLIVKGAATEPRVSCVLQPHDCHQERARYLGCEIATRHTDPLPTIDCNSKSSTHMGNRAILTCIMSTIPRKHMHCINFERCCTFEETSCQNPKFAN